jgi:hypothetical protein
MKGYIVPQHRLCYGVMLGARFVAIALVDTQVDRDGC